MIPGRTDIPVCRRFDLSPSPLHVRRLLAPDPWLLALIPAARDR